MENKNYLIFLFISVLALPLFTATPTMSPPYPPQTSSEYPHMSPEQLHNIIEAIMGANDFRSWADILTTPDPSTFPMTATFFIPTDDAVQSMATSLTRDFDSSIVLYHIVPQELTFSDLQRLPIGYRLATLFRDKSILVTNNTISNFTIDDCLITHPDVIINGAFSVHGIGSVLNSTAYGGKPLHQSPESPDIPKGLSSPIGNVLGHRHSGAPSFFAEFPVILLVCCAVFVFKIQESDLLIDGIIGL